MAATTSGASKEGHPDTRFNCSPLFVRSLTTFQDRSHRTSGLAYCQGAVHRPLRGHNMPRRSSPVSSLMFNIFVETILRFGIDGLSYS